MNADILARLSKLPPLDPQNISMGAPACKICGGRTRFFDVVDFNKHCSFEDYYRFGASGVSIPYHRCSECGFLFTDFFRDWTTADFSRFIYNADYIKVDSEYVEVRPRQAAADMAQRLHTCETARILDYGSGTGVFAERMKEAGYGRIENFDPFSNPVRPSGRFDIITCFEVIEHTPDPINAVRDMKSLLAEDGCIIFSQTLQPYDIEQQRGRWWYIGPRNGHLSTFTPQSLALIAASCGLVFHLGTSPHGFSSPRLSAFARVGVASVGQPLFYLRLTAPSIGGENAQWHAAEQSSAGRFRWSRTSTLTWPPPEFLTGPCSLMVSARVVNQIDAGFASACQFRLADQTVPAEFQDGELRATIALSQPPKRDARLELLTPEPVSPRAMRNLPDDRKLGLAVVTG